MDWLGALIVFLLSPLPLIEMRVSIGLGLFTYHLGAWATFLATSSGLVVSIAGVIRNTSTEGGAAWSPTSMARLS